MPRDYELALIVDTQLSDEGVDEAVTRYESLLKTQGASITGMDRWGARKLAYEIRKRQQGNYTFIQFQSEPDQIAAVDRACRLDEAVLRHLIVLAEGPVVVQDEGKAEDAPDEDEELDEEELDELEEEDVT